MRHVLLTLACLVIPSLALSAPADSTATQAPRNSLRGGVWAMQFDVNGQLLSVDSFAGGLSLKRQFTSKSAVRFGVALGGGSQFDELIRPENPQRTTDSWGSSVEAAYQRYWNPDAVINAYWTLGPLVSYSHASSEQLSGTRKSTAESTTTSLGGIAALGAEWFAARQLSFHGEFTARGTYHWDEDSTTLYQTDLPPIHQRDEARGWNVGTQNAVRLGMSVYF